MQKTVQISEDGGVAIKTVPLFMVDDEDGVEWSVRLQGEAINEAVALKRLTECRCPHIVHVYSMQTDEANKKMIFRERAMHPLPCLIGDSEKVRKYIIQLFEGLYGMHKAGVTHRDIKIDNLMIDPLSEDLCFIDFGLAALDIGPTSRHYQEVYTLFFRPPEILLQSEDYDIEKAEVWAAGACAACMLLGKKALFIGSNWVDIIASIIGAFGYYSSSWEEMPLWSKFMRAWGGSQWIGDKLMERLEDVDPLARDFISKCLVPNPSKRQTVLELLHHKYLSGSRDTGYIEPEITYITIHPVDKTLCAMFSNIRYNSNPLWVYEAEKVLTNIEMLSYPMYLAATAMTGVLFDQFIPLGRSNMLSTCRKLPTCDLILRLMNIPATWDSLTCRYRLVSSQIQ